MDSIDDQATHSDILIVGAGMSGINMAYRIQTELPGYNYTILEGRDAIGGTWDLFRYPGVRSDSDLHTFGFAWQPWKESQTIADGESIRRYITEAANVNGIDKNIRFRHKVLHTNWSTPDQRWSLSVDVNGKVVEYTTGFIVLCTGYYNYKEPLETTIPGLENFRGMVVHPQFWPEDLDYTNKKVVIIGSGASAVTLFPVLAKKASHVTMLQRSPTYILAMPSVDKSATFLRRFLPATLVARIMRVKFLILPFLFVQFCKAFPSKARAVLRANSRAYLPKSYSTDPNFNPTYNPWEQRLCLSPDGDFFHALHRTNTDIVTDTIETTTEDKIITSGGKLIDADIIITATGLQMQVCGGASVKVDDKPILPSSKHFWYGTMIQDIPNSAVVVGYTNAAWTLGADNAAFLICRLLKYMKQSKISSAVPRLSDNEKESLVVVPTLNLKSTYIEKAKNILPLSGSKAPWCYRRNFFIDRWRADWSDLSNGLHFIKKLKDV